MKNLFCLLGIHFYIDKQYNNASQKGIWGKFCKYCNKESNDNLLDCQG